MAAERKSKEREPASDNAARRTPKKKRKDGPRRSLIGRTVYWEPACEYLLGRAAADDAVHRMAANYLAVIELWRRARAR